MGCKGKVSVSIIHPETINHIIWSRLWGADVHCSLSCMCKPTAPPLHNTAVWHVWTQLDFKSIFTFLSLLLYKYTTAIFCRMALRLELTKVPLWSAMGSNGGKLTFIDMRLSEWRRRCCSFPISAPQIGICHWALQCLKHHFLNLWCGKHDLIPVQCFSSDTPSLQSVFVRRHIGGSNCALLWMAECNILW